MLSPDDLHTVQSKEEGVMNTSFENKVALVTGAGSGIGLATAKAFAEAGAAVALADIDEQGARSAAEELRAAGHEVLVVRCDVADEQQVAAMVEQTVSSLGRLDAAFNNAGVQSPFAETADVMSEDFDRVNAINLRGVWSCMKYELLHMREHGSGAIVNCSSMGGLRGAAGRGVYRATKHGVLGLTKCAALEYASPGHPHQRGLSWDRRYADGCTHDGRSSRSYKSSDARRADRATRSARGDRGCRSLALQSRRKLRDWSRARCGWRVHGKLTADVCVRFIISRRPTPAAAIDGPVSVPERRKNRSPGRRGEQQKRLGEKR
jgi:NADP-dependent 3-hydroxy acid dehydrogenase YdfG